MFALAPFVRHQPRAFKRAAALRAWAAATLLVLAALQLLVGSLGVIHQSVHGTAHSMGHRAASLTSGASGTHAGFLHGLHDTAQVEPVHTAPELVPEAHSTQHLLAAWFSGHHSDSDCEWFDRMALGGAWLPAAIEWAVMAPTSTIGWTAHALLLRQSPALFWARGPPSMQG